MTACVSSADNLDAAGEGSGAGPLRRRNSRPLMVAASVVVSAVLAVVAVASPAGAATEELMANYLMVDSRIMFETVVEHESGRCVYDGTARVRTQVEGRRVNVRMTISAIGPCGEAMRQRGSGNQALLISVRTDGRGRPRLIATAGEVVMSGGSTMVVTATSRGAEVSSIFVPGGTASITFVTPEDEVSVRKDSGEAHFGDFGSSTVRYEPGPDGFGIWTSSTGT